MKQLVFLSAGEDEWNDDYSNSVITDTGLSEIGTEEAREAGRVMKMESLQFDIAFTSHQTAAIKTLWLAMEEMGRMWIPVYKTEYLNKILSSGPKEEIEQIDLYFEEEILPSLGLYDTILVVAHKSTISILMGELKGLKNSEIEFPYGVPYVIEFDANFEMEREFFIGN